MAPESVDTSSPVVVVTGASRGAGKGIAMALGAHGAKVYVTGRTCHEGGHRLPGTIEATAQAVSEAGGEGVAVACDHRDDAQVAALFERVQRENGRLDILVNNVCLIPDELTLAAPFWVKPLHMQNLLDVGLRSHYVASWHAAPMMTAQRHGLIVCTSSYGSVCYMHGPAYGAGKAAIDKMTHDMAVDLRPFNVAAISLWMGLLNTERTQQVMNNPAHAGKYKALEDRMESPQFTGQVIHALWQDPDLMRRSGQVCIGAELAMDYGIRDINGTQPPSFRKALGAPPVYSKTVVE